jgi:DNA-binding CsgD family transcriptional regulator
MLFGREEECGRVDAVLEAARNHRGGSLVLRGEAGIGKTALLDYAVERAQDFRVLRAPGVESEAEIAYAGVQQLVRTILYALDELPAPQARALRTALAIEEGRRPERLAVSVATLSLLAGAAEEHPLLCVVDDAHWLDHASADALAFAARRLEAEEVVILFAAREPESATFSAPGLPEVRLQGLTWAAAKPMLAAIAPDLTRHTAERLVELTRGNPLALIEIPRALSKDQLAGHAPLDEPLPIGAETERVFLERGATLSDQARHALLLISASDPRDPDALSRALAAEGLDQEVVAEAEAVGLLAPGQLTFCHPLARSAIYRGARPADRRAAHAALAAATAESDHRAWQLAAAAEHPDESVAAILEDTAGAARRRGGVAAEARALERAAQLTPDREVAARRLFEAALAAEAAGWPSYAETMLRDSADRTSDARLRARAVARRSYLLFDRAEFDQAYAIAVNEAERAAREEAALLLTSSGAVHVLHHRLDIPAALATAERAWRLAGRAAAWNLDICHMLAWTRAVSGRAEEALSLVRSSIRLIEAPTVVAIDLGSDLLYLEDYRLGREVLERVVDRAREADAQGILSYALNQLAKLELRVANLTRAYALELEARQLTEPLGNEVAMADNLAWLGLVESMLGRAESRAHAKSALAIAEDRHDRWNSVRAREALGFDAIARGDVRYAVECLEPAAAMLEEGGVKHPNFFRLDADLVEALVRLGRRSDAERHLTRLEEQSESTGTEWGQAVVARCRAFLSTDTDLPDAFEMALERHDGDRSRFERARTQLCYGERLRRVGRRQLAREQLRAAFETFDRVGARPWAERARTELGASGEHLRRRNPTTNEQLTPQELQIALLVADGLKNRDVGARLFLSIKTIEFHLTRIYRKLQIHSRSELVRRMVGADEQT